MLWANDRVGDLWLLWWWLGLASDPLAAVPLAQAMYVFRGVVSGLLFDVATAAAAAAAAMASCCFLCKLLLLEAWLVGSWVWDGDWCTDLVIESELSVATPAKACDEGEAAEPGAERFLLFLVFARLSPPEWDLTAMARAIEID